MTVCALLLAGAVVGAEERARQKISFSGDILNSAFFYAENVEYSPNQYVDIGVGFSPYAFFIFPLLEAHVYGRVCFVGQNLLPTSDWFGMNWHGFYPALFAGVSPIHF